MDTGQRIESTAEFRDNMLTVSPDALDENLDYIRTLMKSNRHLKKHLKSNLAHYSNQKEVAGSTSPSQSVRCLSFIAYRVDYRKAVINQGATYAPTYL